VNPKIRFPHYPRPRLRKRLTLLLAGLALLLTSGSAAFAFWTSLSSSNYAAAAADSLSPGGKPGVSVAGSSVAVTWQAGSTVGGRPATGYIVARYNAATGGTKTPATGACAGTLTTLSCTEQNVPSGSWYYTVTPAIALWTGAESPRSNAVNTDTIAPTAVASVSPTPNAAGWNNTASVMVNITAQDNAGGSGIASITYAMDSSLPVTVGSATTAVSVTGEGNHSVSFFATDNAGNTSATQSQILKIDSVAPSAPSMSVPAYVNSSNVAAVPVSGTAEAGGTVRLTVTDNRGGSNAITVSTTASGTGAWSLSPNLTTLNQSLVTYKATVTDAAGNTGTTATATATKDTIAPAAATLTVPAYVNIANVAAVPVSGTAESGGTVALTVTDAGGAHTVTASTTVSGAGAWSFSTLNLSTLNQGTLTYSAAASDAAGNAATATTASGTKDTVAPLAPTLTVPAYVRGSSTSAVQASGNTEAGTSVVVTAADAGNAHTATGSAPASGSSAWAATLNLTSLTDGTLTYSAAATDAAGNTGTTAIATGQKDVVPPTVTGLALANGTGTGGNKSTDGTADKGDTLTIQYSEGMDPTKFCPGWNGSSLAGTVTLNDGGTNDTLTFSSTSCSSPSLGSISLGGNYVGTTPAVFTGSGGNASTLTWDGTAKTLTIKLGTLSSGASATLVSVGTPSYTPSGNLTDLAGNPLGTATYTAPTTGKTGF
jgi:hypothetical protein